MPVRNLPSLASFASVVISLGGKPTHVRRLFRAWLGKASWEAPSYAAYPKALEEKLVRLRGELESLTKVTAFPSKVNSSTKLLVALTDGQCVESVLLPRDAVCVSTQVGCAVGCKFCMTGKSGLIRQLTSAEIVAQYIAALKLNPQLKKVVLMGMGEPSHNLQAVKEAVEFLGDVAGLAHKEIVVSSVGDRRLFDAMPTWSVKPAFALSLHTTDNTLREKLLTKAPRIPVEELIEKTVTYAKATKYPAQIEWTLIAGVNDSAKEVERLAELLDSHAAMVNFIAVNPVEGTGFTRPTEEHMQDLITILRSRGFVATVRESAAQDVEGGCGQLRARVLSKESRE